MAGVQKLKMELSGILNRGNNSPVQKGVLKQAGIEAQKWHRCRLIAVIGDAGGVYGYRMQDKSETPFILVAKGSRIWYSKELRDNIVSIQKQCIVTADLLDTHIIMAYRLNKDSFFSWYLFKPSELLKEGYDDNLRSPGRSMPRTRMWNFSFSLGLELEAPEIPR